MFQIPYKDFADSFGIIVSLKFIGNKLLSPRNSSRA